MGKIGSLTCFYKTLFVFLMCMCIHLNSLSAQVMDQADKEALQRQQADKEELQRRSKNQSEETQQRKNEQDVFLQNQRSVAEDQKLPDETPSFPIKTLKLEGEEIDSFSWVQNILDKYSGQRIGQKGINIIVKRLTDELINHGYITTRIVIPEQDLTSGVLRLILVPGKIRDIRIKSDNRQGTWVTAFPTRPGKLLNLRDLEQGLEQMKRVPSQDVDLQLVPGAKPGESDVVIKIKHTNPLKTLLSLDDSGSRATGKLQAATTFRIDNLLGINDIFNVSFNSDAEHEGYLRGTRGQSLSYSFPYGYWTFTLSMNHYDYHQNIQGFEESFLSSGKSDSTQVRIQRLIDRDQTSKTSLQFSITKKENKSYIDDTEITVQRKKVTIAEAALLHRRYMGSTTLDAELACKWGVPWFNAQPDDKTFAQTNRYRIWTADINLATPIKIGSKQAQYVTELQFQTTKDTLFVADYLSIGNRYTVRGFDGEQTLAAEKGWVFRNELDIPVDNVGTETYVALDYGRVYGPASEYLLGHDLAGTALGLRGKIKECNFDVFVGWPIKKPAGYKTDNITLGFQLIYQI
ncbi:ShlB/FhaC/HecB family hemolysin secretion/activation protein [Pelorhabdus rhamnosifermentans]|uniref:ShlB/FhaC/HecB family hemolysin secretion/activation protein n=1 Tax=Pelorhabdus rhamnosifermentans TaxID=2772457 RepID=UPI001FE3DAD3|nr:ShlB/FhaC/HecB family hemolysin secretion/activation protein [Pelorhabdus rhamnosifermentans]